MRLQHYLTEMYSGKPYYEKKWSHQYMIITADHGGKGIYVTYSGQISPGGREINKEYITKSWEEAEKKIKAYIKKSPYDEKDFKVTTK